MWIYLIGCWRLWQQIRLDILADKIKLSHTYVKKIKTTVVCFGLNKAQSCTFSNNLL